VRLVVRERDRARDLYRHRVDAGGHLELAQHLRELAVEVRDRAGLERHRAPGAVRALEGELVREEIETHLEAVRPARHE